MGSLMSGWDCNIPDPKVVNFKRNKSLTKEEIEAFWRSRKHREEDGCVLSPLARTQIQANDEETAKTITSDEEKLINKHGWWVSSNLAHLNEPPVLAPEEAATYKRVSLFKQAQTG